MTADPRGPRRKIVAVDSSNGQNHVTTDCGHRSKKASHMHFTVGRYTRCFHCGPHGTHKDLAALEAAGVPGAAEDRRKVWQEIMKGESK